MRNRVLLNRVHLRVRLLWHHTRWLEHCVPSKHFGASCRYDPPGSPAFEDDGFGAWSSGVGECADSFGGGVVEAYEHFVEAFVPDVGHEVFDVGTWEAVEGCEGEGGVFCYAGAIDLKFRDIHSEQIYGRQGG